MTETSSKGVLRLTIAMFLSVGLLGMWIGGCGNQTPEQKIERPIEELRDEDWIVRADAAAELGRMGEGAKDAVPALIQALQDSDAEVRYNATWALGNIGEGAVPALIQALQGPDEGVRWNAAEALGKIGTPEALEAVKKYQSR